MNECRERPAPARPLLRKTIGEVLRRTRVRQGRTLADVARAARVSMAYLSELERGRKDASSEVLAAVCAGLSITLSQLVTEVSRELRAARAPQAPVVSLDAYRALLALRPGPADRRRSRPRAARAGAASVSSPVVARPKAAAVPLRLVA